MTLKKNNQKKLWTEKEREFFFFFYKHLLEYCMCLHLFAECACVCAVFFSRLCLNLREIWIDVQCNNTAHNMCTCIRCFDDWVGCFSSLACGAYEYNRSLHKIIDPHNWKKWIFCLFFIVHISLSSCVYVALAWTYICQLF